MDNTPKGLTIVAMDNLSIGEQESASDCTHYWVIESPRGPVSNGVCKLCNEEREFRNSFANSGWER